MSFNYFRELERLLIVCFGGVSLVLGWDLFKKGVLDPSQAYFEKGEWKVSLKKVGPGVFFALFGAAILIFGIVTEAKYTKTTKETQPNTGKKIETIEKWERYAKGDSRRKNIEAVIQAINSIIYNDKIVEMIKLNSGKVEKDLKIESVGKAMVILTQYRDNYLTTKIYSNEVINAYLASDGDSSKIKNDELKKYAIEYDKIRKTDLLNKYHK